MSRSPRPRQKTTFKLIAEAAIQWELARVAFNALVYRRNGYRCELASPAEPEVGDPGVPPCHGYSSENAPTDDWCDLCRERQEIHDLIAPAKDLTESRLRALRKILQPLSQRARRPR